MSQSLPKEIGWFSFTFFTKKCFLLFFRVTGFDGGDLSASLRNHNLSPIHQANTSIAPMRASFVLHMAPAASHVCRFPRVWFLGFAEPLSGCSSAQRAPPFSNKKHLCRQQTCPSHPNILYPTLWSCFPVQHSFVVGGWRSMMCRDMLETN